MLLAGEWEAPFGVPDHVVKGGCAVSGIFELDPLLQCSINETLRMDSVEPGAGRLVTWYYTNPQAASMPISREPIRTPRRSTTSPRAMSEPA